MSRLSSQRLNNECLSLSKLNNEIADGLYLFSTTTERKVTINKDSKGGKTGNTKVDSQKKAGNGQGKNSAEIDKQRCAIAKAAKARKQTGREQKEQRRQHSSEGDIRNNEDNGAAMTRTAIASPITKTAIVIEIPKTHVYFYKALTKPCFFFFFF